MIGADDGSRLPCSPMQDSTNLTPQPLVSRSFSSILRLSAAPVDTTTVDAENVPPQADRRKRPRSEDAEDEPDGRVDLSFKSHGAQRTSGIFSPANLVMKRQRLDIDRSSALNLVKQERQDAPQPAPPWGRGPEAAASPVNLVKRECTIALRCHVEHKRSAGSDACGAESVQKFAIIPNSVRVANLLHFVLQCLDIKASAEDCTATIQLPNWKALSLTDVCDDPVNTSAVMLLSQVSNIAVLHVELPAMEAAMLPSYLIRNLLKALIPHHSPNAGMHIAWFKQAGCPLSDATIEEFLSSPEDYEFPPAERKQFSDWHSRMCLQYLEQVTKGPSLYHLPLPLIPPLGDSSSLANSRQSSDDDSRSDELRQQQQQQQQQQPALGLLQQQLLRDSRVNRGRTTFDADVELPLLQQWFALNPHPSREQIEQYKVVLNHLPSRRSRRPLDVANIVYWFKNMRANEKRLSSGMKMEEEACGSEMEAEEAPAPVSDEERVGKENSEVLGMAGPWTMPSLLRNPSSSFLAGTQDCGTPKPDFDQTASPAAADSSSSCGAKRRRTRVFIDPVTEIPQLESWFAAESHPTSAQFQLYASILNSMPFRQKQPSLEAKNIQLWFKNHRAKVKRERLDVSADNNPDASSTTDVGIPVPVSPSGSDVVNIDAKSDALEAPQVTTS